MTAAFEHRRDDRIEAARARMAAAGEFPAKVVELAKILDEDGYLASAEPLGDGGYRIAERNCAIFAVAREHPQACSTEIEFLRAAFPEATIERVTHMMAGAHSCSYEVRPRCHPMSSTCCWPSACCWRSPHDVLDGQLRW